MNWGDYFVGMVSGLGIGASVIGFLSGKTINTYRKIVSDYERMVTHLIHQLTGINPERLQELVQESSCQEELEYLIREEIEHGPREAGPEARVVRPDQSV